MWSRPSFITSERRAWRGVLVLGVSFGVAAQVTVPPSPSGLWRTMDDDSGQPKSLVRVSEAPDGVAARIEKLLDPEDSPDALCDKCADERRNQRILGMTILRHGKPKEGKPGVWEGGDILDPENGKVYRVRLTLSPDGRRLEVRGYIGTPLLGRTQVWTRVE